MANENQIKIVGVKTADVLSDGQLADNTIFVCGNRSELKKIAYSNIKTDINRIINAYPKTETSSSSELSTEFAKYQPKSGMSDYLLTETADDNYAPKDPDSPYFYRDDAIELSDALESKITQAAKLSAATTSQLGGIKLYGTNELTNYNNIDNARLFKVELNNSSKAYVELNDNKISTVIFNSQPIINITDEITELTGQIDKLCSDLAHINIEAINKTIGQVNAISNNVIDLINTDAYMFGTCTRYLYLDLSADSNNLFNGLYKNGTGILSILGSSNIDQTRFNNLSIEFTFEAPDNPSTKLKYKIEANTNDGTTSYSASLNCTENNISVLHCNSSNELIQIISKIDDNNTFEDNNIALSDAIRFLPNDNFQLLFSRSLGNTYAAKFYFENFASGQNDGYVFRQLSNNTLQITNTRDDLNALSAGESIRTPFYTNVFGKLSNDLNTTLQITNTRADLNALSAEGSTPLFYTKVFGKLSNDLNNTLQITNTRDDLNALSAGESIRTPFYLSVLAKLSSDLTNYFVQK